MYDLAILGGGPGGYTAAIKAGRAGLKTVVIEKDEVGGTCLQRGCIPTKYLLHTAESYHTMHHNDLGLTAPTGTVDFNNIYTRKNAIVGQLTKGIEMLFENADVTHVRGEGSFVDAHTISVNGQNYEAKNIIIATGSVVSYPPVKGADTGLSSDDILGPNPINPESVIVVGGGVIGVEFATYFALIGKKVQLVQRSKQILRDFDKDTAIQSALMLKKHGISVTTGVDMTEITPTSCTFTKKGKTETVTADAVVVCMGRAPLVDGFGLEKTGVEYDKKGIVVDEYCQTSVPHIWAVGDVVKGNIMLAHNAEHQGAVIAENLAHNTKNKPSTLVPSCVYSLPEVAAVGLSEKSAEAQGVKVKVGKVPIGSNGRALTMGLTTGFIKVLFNEQDVFVGCQLMCHAATDMIGAFGTMIAKGVTYKDITSGMYPHPTISEVFYEAVENVYGNATNVLQPK